MFTTRRISTRVLFSGSENGVPVLFLHGNLASSSWWESTMMALPEGFRGIAFDQRGFGGADRARKIDATRGLGDLADDANALLDALGIQRAIIVGHSMGGAVIWRMLMDYPHRFIAAVMVAPGSPFGFGGTKDIYGTPCHDDFAGTGAGMIHPRMVSLLTSRNTTIQQFFSNMMMQQLWKHPPQPGHMQRVIDGMMSVHLHDFPGDKRPSRNWPNFAPGRWGINNALSPQYADDIDDLFIIRPKPPILWIRGTDDRIVSDRSVLDVAVLGEMGFIPGWPGRDVYCPQPMVSQTRAVLDEYERSGGVYHEAIIKDAGHVPYIEKAAQFNAAFHPYLRRHMH